MPDRVVTYSFRGNFSNIAGGMTALGRNVQETGAKLTALDRDGQKMRRGLEVTGRTAGRMGLVAAAGFAVIEHAAMSFDKAMSNVEATGAATTAQLKELRDAALEAGQTTAYSAGEAAGGIEALLKAGVTADDVIGGGLKGSLDLAAAGELAVGDAAEIAATAMTQFKLSGQDVGHVADLLAAGAGKAQGGVSDLSMALKQSGLVASQMGLTVDETVGTLTAFASAGLLGSDAGTSFRTMLLRLANPTEESKKLMAALGIQAYDTSGKFVGMASIAGQLQTAFEGKTQAERDSALATIFGSDAIRAAAVLYAQGTDGVNDWTSKVNDAGYASEVAGTRLDNLSGDVHKFGSALQTALIGSGEGGQGALRGLVQDATKAVNAFNDLPAPVQSTTTKLLGLTAVVGGAAWFGAKTITGIASTRQALADLGVSADSTAGKVGRIGARAGAVLIAAQAIGALVNATTDLGNAVDTTDVTRGLESLSLGLEPESIDELTNALEGLNEVGGGTVNALFSIPSALTGIDTSFETSKRTVAEFDEALASMVESGDADKAAAAFAAIREAAAAHGGVSDNDVVKSFDAYAAALANLNAEQKKAAAAQFGNPFAWLYGLDAPADQDADAISGLADASEDNAAANKAQTREINKATQAMRDQRDAALSAFDAETQWGQAVADAAAQVKTGEKGINRFTEAGQHNRAALSELASAWNNQSNAVKNNQDRYDKARQTFLDVAEDMGVPKRAAKALADQLLQVPRSTVAEVVVKGAKEGKDDVVSLQRQIAALKDRTVHINVVRGHEDTGGGDFNTVEDPKKHPRTSGRLTLDPLTLGQTYVSGRTGGYDKAAALGGVLGKIRQGADDASEGLTGLRQQLKASQAALDAETRHRENLQAQRDDARSAVRGSIENDLFEMSSDPFAANPITTDPLTAAKERRARAERFLAAIQALKKKGLHGAALQAILGEGLEAAEYVAAQSDSYASQFASELTAAAQITAQAANAGATGVVSVKEMAETNHAIHDLTHTVKHLEHKIEELSKHHRRENKENTHAAAREHARALNGWADEAERDRH